MARRKEFDPKKALRAAVDAFWDSGFEKTSLDDLMTRMNLGRQSLYDTFGNKRSLYLLALEEYRAMTQAASRDLFDSGLDVRDCFKAILYGIADASKADLERGCMMVNANLQRARNDKALAALIRRNALEVRQLFTTVLRSAQRAGEIDREIDPDAVSAFMFATVHGMRHIGRATADRAALRQVAHVAISTLG
jgi:TetR/AcrR family transcriptional regulator, transcriptional repressor for nem operon